MKITKPRIIIIVGPNASGKSELAVKLAKKFSGEIISADSRQIYRGLDIGTGKVPGVWGKKIFSYKKIPHYCIDFVSPQKQYSVAEFKKCAEAAIKDINARGKTPFLVGGTGFWIDAIIYDLDLPRVPSDLTLRKNLSQKSPQELFKILQKLDSKRAQGVEPKNPRRLIRAIEIAKSLGKVPVIKKKNPYKTLWLGVKIVKNELKKRVHKRLLKRLQKGMIAEARRLRKDGLSWKRFYELGLEYKFLADYLRGKINKKEMIEKLEKANLDYARRQMVWFKKNTKINWVNNHRTAESLTRNFY